METLEMWMLVDAAGDYAVGKDEDEAKERYVETIQPVEDSGGFRMVKVFVRVTLPAVIELEAEAEPEEEPAAA